MLVGLLASGLSTGLRLLAVGVGAVALFIGISMLAPKLVPPLVQVLGWPATKIGGAAGKLAEGNSARNPARTASTASALMIGLALVTLVGVLAAGLRTAVQERRQQGVRRQLRDHGHQQLLADQPRRLSRPCAASREWTGVIGVRAGDGKAFGSTSTSPASLRTSARRSTSIGQAGGRGVRRSSGTTARSSTRITPRPSTCRSARRSRVETPTGQVPASEAHRDHQPAEGRVAVRRRLDLHGAASTRDYQNPQNLYTFVNMQGGVTPANTQHARTSALSGFPDAKLQTEGAVHQQPAAGASTRCSTCSTCCCRCRSSSACSGSSTRWC